MLKLERKVVKFAPQKGVEFSLRVAGIADQFSSSSEFEDIEGDEVRQLAASLYRSIDTWKGVEIDGEEVADKHDLVLALMEYAPDVTFKLLAEINKLNGLTEDESRD